MRAITAITGRGALAGLAVAAILAATGSAALAAEAPPAAEVPAPPKASVAFNGRTARLGGPGLLVGLRCEGLDGEGCTGSLALAVAGIVHKAPFSIADGSRQIVVVPLGDDGDAVAAMTSATAQATAVTVQASGASARVERTLKVK